MATRVVLHVLELPLRQPFSNSSGPIGTRSTVLVELADGRSAWGEAAPFPGQDETIEDLIISARRGDASPTLAAAIDEAEAAADGAIPASIDEPRPCVAIGLDDPVRVAAEAAASGVTAFKVKVAPNRLDHVADIRRRHPDAVMGVDGNRSFTAADIDLALWRDLHLAFVEELFIDWDESMRCSFPSLGVPHFADESVREVESAGQVLGHPAVDGITLKPGRLGWSGALAASALAADRHKRWRSSGLLETSIGRSFSNALALHTSAFVSDVAPASWFMADVVDAVEGLPTAPIVPSPELVARYRIDRIEVAVEST